MEHRNGFDRLRAEEILNSLITAEQWQVCSPLIKEGARRGLRFALGGGLAASAYSGYLRNTKDMDFFVLPPDHEPLMKLMQEEGFEEYTTVPYDKSWSYRGVRQGYIVDLLWCMLNGRTSLDDIWISAGLEVEVRKVELRLLPPEELIWSKLYILRRERTDWPDILNIIFTQGIRLDWERLLSRLEEDCLVLGSVMNLFRWMCPGSAEQLPRFIWERMGLSPQVGSQAVDRRRTALFNSGDWFPAREELRCS